MAPQRIFLTLLTLTLCWTSSACGTQWDVTRPGRLAIEQRLISTAADRAATRLANAVGTELGKTYLEVGPFEGIDKNYALHAIRGELISAGVVLVETKELADTILEVSSGALSIDYDTTLIGMPPLQIPVPLAGQVGLPEAALYKEVYNQGLAKFSVLGYRQADGSPIIKRTVLLGTAYSQDLSILFFLSLNFTDLEEPPEEPNPNEK